MIREAEPKWFKSSYSSGSEGDSCVEVAAAVSVVRVRDSKVPDGPRLAFTSAAWVGFVAGVGAWGRGAV
ncbi:DUF397 domain-containing protein [Streptomyces sp. NPDC006879]|uniref:DUF397 domain-containing protein n=1 Tax=Streptomyces sp. NPDC006879 TaxID=3364767 RepID=UPI0036A1C916